MAASISRQFSTTVDEIAHLTAGYNYITNRDFRLQPENGLFPQLWCALPLRWQSVQFPATTSQAWSKADVWLLGHQFFHESGNDRNQMLASARAMNALLSAALCGSLFFLARMIHGPMAGLLALLLAVFSPSLLAQASVATSDTAATLGFVLATLAWWRLLHRLSLGRILCAGAALGLLALSKYSVVLFAPLALLLAVLRLVRSTALPVALPFFIKALFGRSRVIAVFAAGLITIIISWGMVWSAYGLRYSASPTGQPGLNFAQSWDSVLLNTPPGPGMTMADGSSLEPVDLRPGPLQTSVAWAREHRLLPEAYLYGFAFVAKHSRGRLAYFAGDYRLTGWWEFFPTAFVTKTSLAALVLMVLGLASVYAVAKSRRRVWLYRSAPVFGMLGVYWGFALTSRLNIGYRHLLPVEAFSYIIAAGSCAWMSRQMSWRAVIGGLTLAHLLVSGRIRPDYLAYFNELAGGPAHAHRLFVDSSLDWGQDLPRLRTWLAAHAQSEPVYLSYFGSGSPAHEGIKATRFGDGYFDWAPRKTPPVLGGGIYCLSATMLHRVYTHVRGPWSDRYEKRYQELSVWVRHVRTQPKTVQPTEVDGSPLALEVINARLFHYEQLQFGRLCHYLEQRPVDARAGFSMMIYRLSETEVQFALEAPLASVNAALAQSKLP